MTARLRIRPRLCTARSAAQAPWRWIPLSLVFLKRRLAVRPAPAIAQASSASPQPVSYFTRHLHYHTYEGARIFLRTNLRETILREQSEMLRSSPRVAARPDPASSVLLLHTHERGMETRLGLRVTRDQEQVYTRIHRIERIARESEIARLQRTITSAVDTMVLSAQQRFPIKRLAWSNDASRALAARGRSIERTAEIRMEPPQSKITRETPTRWRSTERSRAADVSASFAVPAPIQQVWRMQPAHESTRETVSTFSPTAGAQPVSRSQFAATQIPTGNQTPKPPALRKLDGPEMDRIADNVMKRIERHVRIERERRGK